MVVSVKARVDSTSEIPMGAELDGIVWWLRFEARQSEENGPEEATYSSTQV